MGKSERLIGGNDHVCTPERIWSPIVAALGKGGKFALDPMTNPRSRVPAVVRITNWGPADKLPKGFTYGDGLKVSWTNVGGCIWLNGPYSTLKEWFHKADEAAGQGAEIVAFAPVRTSGFAWQHYAWYADAILWLSQRVQHDGENFTAPFHQAVIYWGPRVELFRSAVKGLGTLFWFEQAKQAWNVEDLRGDET